MTITRAYISLGSNQGDREKMLAKALGAVDALKGVSVLAASSLYETEPQGDAAQPWFLNQAACLGCSNAVTPEGLLDSLLAIEAELGRSRDPARRFGPRAIDLDLLLFGRVALRGERLTLPHPRMAERAFVLVPLVEIEPDLLLPCGRSVAEVLGGLEYRVEGRKIFQG